MSFNFPPGLWEFVLLALFGAAVFAVTKPLFGHRPTWQTASQSQLDLLFEGKARALRALKDLDHEREAGMLSDDDWREGRAQHLADAVRLNREIVELTGVAPPGGDVA